MIMTIDNKVNNEKPRPTPFPVPQSPDELNKWPQILLDRFCECWGERIIKRKLRILIILRSITVLSSQHMRQVFNDVYLIIATWNRNNTHYYPRTCSVEGILHLFWDWMPWRSFGNLGCSLRGALGFPAGSSSLHVCGLAENNSISTEAFPGF